MHNNSLSLSSKLPGTELSIFSVMTALAQKHNAINLAQGFPDFNCPAELIDLVYKEMQAGRNQYAPMPGILSLREEISKKIAAMYDANYDPETEITVTAGATQAIYTAITALVREKDEVVIFEPAYDSYLPAILLNKGAPKYVCLSPPDYRIDWEQVKKLITSRTKVIIINTPHNPSGMIFTHEDMLQLQKLVSGKDIFIISDEVYEHIVFDGSTHESVTKYPELAMRSFVISSFGKTYHTTGWKTGYVLAPKELMDEFRKVFTYAMFSTFTPVQYAFAEYMKRHPEMYLELPEFYEKKRNLFLESIAGSKFVPIPSHGTYFQCLDYSAYSEENDKKFAEYLTTEVGVAAIPTSVFYHDKQDFNVLRFCFAKTDETLRQAGERLCKI